MAWEDCRRYQRFFSILHQNSDSCEFSQDVYLEVCVYIRLNHYKSLCVYEFQLKDSSFNFNTDLFYFLMK